MSAVLDDHQMQRLLDRLAPVPVPEPEPASAAQADRAPPVLHAARVPRRRWKGAAALAVVMAAGAAGAAYVLAERPASDAAATEASRHSAAVAAVAASAPAGASADGVLLQASGYVVAERQATVSAEVTGRLAALHVQAGDHVKRGQLLAELDPSALDAQIALAGAELAAQRQSRQEIGLQISQAQKQLDRANDLVAQGFVSQQQAETERYKLALLNSQRSTHERQVEVSERQLQLRRKLAGQLRVVAPFAGIVTESAAQVGEIVSPVSVGGFTRSGICTLVDLQTLLVEVKVNEKFIQRVSAGQAVQVSLHADASVRQQGRVSAVMPAAERETGTVKVRIALPDPNPRILPNMGVDVAFLGPNAASSPPGVLR